MKFSLFKDLIIPKAGVNHFFETFLTWSGVGFTATLLADLLDRFSNISYASYYTNAINDAVGYQFWVLLSEIALLLFCVSLPILSLSTLMNGLETLGRRVRRVIYTFFLVAFDEGALMIGILLANFVYTGDRIQMLVSKSFLFSDVGIFSILSLCLLNSILWLLGESIYNRDDHSVSGVVQLLMKTPIKYTIQGYLIVTVVIIFIVNTR